MQPLHKIKDLELLCYQILQNYRYTNDLFHFFFFLTRDSAHTKENIKFKLGSCQNLGNVTHALPFTVFYKYQKTFTAEPTIFEHSIN
jgi:hypothetical protein